LLGIPLTPVCTVTCSRTDYTVKFEYPTGLVKNTNYEVTIEDILNPETSGVTGNFQLKTIKGANVIDSNLIFNTIGIGDKVKLLTSVVMTSTDLRAGNTATYRVQFKTITALPINSYFRLTVPQNGFTVQTAPVGSFYTVHNS